LGAIENFLKISTEERFKGWSVVGDYISKTEIPFFGETLDFQLETGNGVEDYTCILRQFGWVVTFGLNEEGNVITLVQWKPGVNRASWELPPGGIGKVNSNITEDERLDITQEIYLRETGFGDGEWKKLGQIMMDSAKYRGTKPDDHGFFAHLYLATGLKHQSEARDLNPNEIMQTLMVPIEEFKDVILSGHFAEASAVVCAFLALNELGKL
jgi:hypothetical protein